MEYGKGRSFTQEIDENERRKRDGRQTNTTA